MSAAAHHRSAARDRRGYRGGGGDGSLEREASPEEETQPKIADYSISEKWPLHKDLIFFSRLLNVILGKIG